MARSAAPVSARSDSAAAAGSTQSLPLAPLGQGRALRDGAGVRDQGIAPRDVRPFSLVGVIWDDADAELHGRVQVRTRAADTADWSDWQDVETHNSEHAADPGSAERESGERRGATAPLWVGASDGVEVRVRAEEPSDGGQPSDAGQASAERAQLPDGLRLELVDPGADPVRPADTTATATATATLPRVLRDDPQSQGAQTEAAAPLTAEAAASSAVNAQLAPLGALVIPALSKEETEADLAAARGEIAGKPYIGPRPGIITRKGWGADERLRERSFLYTKTVKAAFVHHTATGNNYSCAQAPALLRAIYRYHTLSSGWRDFGYNFAIDKCGNIYEGRAGGVTKPVMGAHTLGFNSNTTGIAVLGTYTSKKPPTAALNAVAKLTAWKLGLFGRNPEGTTSLTSGGSNLHAKGKNVRLNVISGHRDGFATECPGRQLYGKLGTARSTSARLQGR